MTLGEVKDVRKIAREITNAENGIKNTESGIQNGKTNSCSRNYRNGWGRKSSVTDEIVRRYLEQFY